MYNSKSGRLGVGLLVAAAALLLVPAQAAVASSTITAVTAGGFTLTPSPEQHLERHDHRLDAYQ